MPDIIIGIDFGTTFSGVSWTVVVNGRGGRNIVSVINDWPHPHSRNPNNDKVPSAISYTGTGEISGWGFEVSHDPNSFKFRWMKILLEPSHKYYTDIKQVKFANADLERLKKTPEDVVNDYLSCLWKYTVEHLKRKKGDNFQEDYNVKVVLTVPAVWSDSGKDKTLKAARAAGIPGKIELVTEPEAAAIAVLNEKNDLEELKVGDGFVVCDAGGGTVDLISYRVDELNPLRLEECVVGDGDLCGSIFLDIAFHQHITTLVGEDVYSRIKASAKRRMIEDFEHQIKRNFSKQAGEDDLWSVDLRGVEDDPEKGIEDDTIQIRTNSLTAIFDVVCLKIQGLVERQIIQMEENRVPPKAILLVGGFGESKYLYDHLRIANSHSKIKIIQEPQATSAVCRGATIWGSDYHRARRNTQQIGSVNLVLGTTIKSRIARCSYGLIINVPFKDGEHRIEDRFFDKFKGISCAKNQMHWLLKRGETITEGRTLTLQYYYNVKTEFWRRLGDRKFEDVLLYSQEYTPPTRYDPNKVKILCRIPYKIPYSKINEAPAQAAEITGKKFREAHMDVHVCLKCAVLEFRLLHGGKSYGFAEALYVDP